MFKRVSSKSIIFIFLLFKICVYGQPRIQLRNAEVDFGQIEQNQTKSKVLLFRNVGNEELKVKKKFSSCGCSSDELIVKDASVFPRGTGEIVINFKSEKFIGAVQKNLYVHTNDPENKTVAIRVKANVKAPSIVIEYFYSENCEDCLYVREKILDKLSEKYNLRVKDFNLADSANQKYLAFLEGQYGDAGDEIPVIVVGEDMLRGLDEIGGSLGDKIPELWRGDGESFDNSGSKGFRFFGSLERVRIVYFFDKSCEACLKVGREISFLERESFSVKRYDIDARENKRLNEAFCEVYGVPEDKRLTTPMVFAGRYALTYKDLRETNIREFVYEREDSLAEIPWEKILKLNGSAEVKIKERFEQMGIFAVFFAGLIDGVNPCAFTTIVFFIAFLASIGKKRREMLLVGITYSSVVFVVYFLIGLGLVKAIGALVATVFISRVILLAVAGFSFFLGIVSLYDLRKLRKGDAGKVKLQLPRFIKKNIHSVIREKMKMRNLFAAAIVSGFFISLSEFICTGQIYLPTLVFVSGIQSLRIKALMYLFVYNIAFISPLVIVFVSTYKGMSSSVLSRFWKNNVGLAKLLSATFFVSLGVLLVLYVFFL